MPIAKQTTDLITIDLAPIKFKRRDQNLTVSARQIVDLDSDLLENMLDQLSKKLKSKEDTYSPAEVLVDVLTTPEVERETKGDDKGKPKKNPQTGQFVAKPFSIKTQRIINRILNEVEPKLDKMGEDRAKHKSFPLKLKPKDALYLAKRMVTYFDEFASVQTYVPDAYDLYYNLKQDATKVIDASD